MPCDSVQMNRIDMPTMDPLLLDRGLTAMGATEVERYSGMVTFSYEGDRYRIQGGQLTSYDAGTTTLERTRNAVARGYSGQVLGVAAQKNNWSLKQVGERQYVAQKRGR